MRLGVSRLIVLLVALPMLSIQIPQANQLIRTFEAKDLNGTAWNFSRIQGKVVLIDFWATWCPHCLAELPHLKSAYERFHEQGFEILGVSLDAGARRDFERFLRMHRINWPQIFEGRGYGGKLAQHFNVEAVPESLLIDPEGKVVAKNPRGDELRKLLEHQLGKDKH
jgi:thiol-disulfide isomerase/thioredoxin